MGSILETVLSISLTGGVLTLLLLLLKPLIKNRVSKSFSYYIWLIVLVRLAVPFGFQVNMSEYNTYEPYTVESVKNEEDTAYSKPDFQKPVTPYGNLITANGTQHENVQTKRVFNAAAFKSFVKENLLYIWLIGVAISVMRYTLPYFSFVNKLRRSGVACSAEDVAVFKSVCPYKNIKLFQSADVSTPMLIGLFKPRIMLPYMNYTQSGMTNELVNVFRHELTHYRRHDIAYKWFIAAVTSLHWFNPAVYFIRRETLHACELSCDEAVIREMTAQQRKSYGNTLLTLAASSSRLPFGVTASTMCEEKKQLKGRLISIMKYKKKTGTAIALAAVLVISLAGCASTVVKKDDETTIAQQTTENEGNETVQANATIGSTTDKAVTKSTQKLEYTKVEYNKAPNEKSKVKIMYPVFTGDGADNLNKIIDNMVTGYATINTDFFSAEEGLTLDYNSEVTLNDGKTVSIVFWGDSNMESSAYPTTSLYTLYYDLTDMKEIALLDLYNVNADFAKTFFSKAYYPKTPSTSYDETLFEEMLSGQEGFEPFAYPEYISFYLKPDSVVLSMSAVHATGSDHFEGEVKSSDIAGFKK